MIPGSANPLLLASAAGDYQVSRSLRFNSSDSAFCSRTPGTASTSKTWTLSFWVKLTGKDGGSDQNQIFGAASGSGDTTFYRLWIEGANGGTLNSGTGSGITQLTTTNLLRDYSAWYHILVAFDTTQSTAGLRHRVYINGIEGTYATNIAPSFNTAYSVNSTATHWLGFSNISGRFFNGYLADCYMIDGQALTPSSFTEVSATTGQLIPKTYSGTYGTNGFQLKFADNSSNTATTLGKDTSGNSNNWTPNNLSVTAGAGNDSLVDTPTSYGTDTSVGGEVRGNYATLNPLSAGAGATLSNGNLDLATDNANVGQARSTIGVSSGKWYFEVVKTGGSANPMIGIVDASTPTSNFPGQSAGSYGYYGFNGNKYNNNSPSAYGASYGANDVIGVALDLDAGTLVFYKNGVSQGTAYSSLSGTFFPALADDSGSTSLTATANFGQRAFAHPVSGFKALCDTNIAEGTITTSGTYTGNGVADGPFVYLNGVPTAMTVGVNAVTFGTDADKLSNGFKLRTTNVLYNQNALSYSYSITTTGAKFKFARAQPNP